MPGEGLIPAYDKLLFDPIFKCTGSFPSVPTVLGMQFHLDHPGVLGNSNLAGYHTLPGGHPRPAIVFAGGIDAVTGIAKNTSLVQLLAGLATLEDINYFTIHTSLTLGAGTCIVSGSVSSGAIAIGDTPSFPVGAVSVAVGVAVA